MPDIPVPSEPATAPLAAAALRGRCPRCGEGALFAGAFTLGLAPACPRCGLDYTFADPGDGPAVFAIMVLGAVVLGAAMIAEFVLGVPLWAHIALWGVTTPLLAFLLLRVLKGTLVALQLRHGARPAGAEDLER